MSFIRDYRDRRRETKLKLKAAKAKAKEDARHEAKLKDKAYREGVRAADRERKDDLKAADKQRKADLKASKKQRKAQAKLDKKALKRAGKIRKAGAKDEAKALKAKHKHQTKMAEKILEQQRSQGFTSDKAKGWVGGTRLLLPVALPLAYRAMTWVQNRNHDADARKFGVSGDAVARYHGYGAPLRARVHAVRNSLQRLEDSRVQGAGGFVKDARDRLDVIVDAIETSEHMTPEQRRRAHASISSELDGIDSEIMSTMGLTA